MSTIMLVTSVFEISNLQILLFSMLSTKFDRELLAHFVPYYVGIGVDPHNMYLVLHSEGGVRDDIEAALKIIGNYPVNYMVFTEPFLGSTKFEIVVCALGSICYQNNSWCFQYASCCMMTCSL